MFEAVAERRNPFQPDMADCPRKLLFCVTVLKPEVGRNSKDGLQWQTPVAEMKAATLRLWYLSQAIRVTNTASVV
jgi:hypothetical protein